MQVQGKTATHKQGDVTPSTPFPFLMDGDFHAIYVICHSNIP